VRIESHQRESLACERLPNDLIHARYSPLCRREKVPD
jgi:hypothetical protein